MARRAADKGPKPEEKPVMVSWYYILLTLALVGLLLSRGIAALGIALGTVAGIILGLGIVIWTLVRARMTLPEGWQAGYLSLLEHTHCGEYEQAEAVYRELVAKTDKLPYYQAMVHQAAGMLYFRRGRHTQALECVDEALRLIPKQEGWMIKSSDLDVIRARCLALYAEVHVVLERTPQATEALEKARAIADGNVREELVLAEVLIQCRSGRFEDVAGIDLRKWLQLEGVLPQRQMKLHRLLRAFSLSKSDATPAREEECRTMLAGLRPCLPNEFDFLCGRWPDLKAFVIRNDLSAPLDKSAVA